MFGGVNMREAQIYINNIKNRKITMSQGGETFLNWGSLPPLEGVYKYHCSVCCYRPTTSIDYWEL